MFILLGGRDKEIYWATGLVKESRMRIMADLRGRHLIRAVWAEGVNAEGSGNNTHLPDCLLPRNLQISRATGTGLPVPAWPQGELCPLMKSYMGIKLFQFFFF